MLQQNIVGIFYIDKCAQDGNKGADILLPRNYLMGNTVPLKEITGFAACQSTTSHLLKRAYVFFILFFSKS